VDFQAIGFQWDLCFAPRMNSSAIHTGHIFWEILERGLNEELNTLPELNIDPFKLRQSPKTKGQHKTWRWQRQNKIRQVQKQREKKTEDADEETEKEKDKDKSENIHTKEKRQKQRQGQDEI
jgi:hypothetical protein